MEIRKTLSPGEPGTKQHQRRFGEKLVCVRYRYNDEKKQRYTTVELIVDQRPYIHYHAKAEKKTQAPEEKNKQVYLRIPFNDLEARNTVKKAGGSWDAVKRAWKIDKQTAIEIGMKERMINNA